MTALMLAAGIGHSRDCCESKSAAMLAGMHICIHADMHTCIYIHTCLMSAHVCLYTRCSQIYFCMYIHTCMQLHMARLLLSLSLYFSRSVSLCVPTYIYIILDGYVHVCMYVYMDVCKYIYIYHMRKHDVCMYVRMYVCTYVCMRTHACVHAWLAG